MGAWVDDPDWGGETGQRLLARLAEKIGDTTASQKVAVDAGVPKADLPTGPQATARMVWEVALPYAGQRPPMLKTLLEQLRDNRPDLKVDMKLALAATRAHGADTWYHPTPPETARLLGPGLKRSLIGRGSLGGGLVRITGQAGISVLSIRGAKGMGKSHSRWLLNHLVQATRSAWTPVGLEVEVEWPAQDYVGTELTVSTSEFLRRLAGVLGVDQRPVDILDPHDEPRVARDLASEFVGRYLVRERPPRILVVDGLDRLYLSPSIGVAISHLASKIVSGDLPNLRLIVTGYQGAFGDDVLDALDTDDAQPLAETQLLDFFWDVATQTGHHLSPAQTDELVQETLALATLTDHRAVGREASAIARRHFGPAA